MVLCVDGKLPLRVQAAFCTGCLWSASSVRLPVGTVVGTFVVGVYVVDRERAEIGTFLRTRILSRVGVVIVNGLT